MEQKKHCGKCFQCCGQHIPTTREERYEINFYLQEKKIDIPFGKPGYCKFLNEKGKCVVYEVRPKICRWFGEFDGMLKCPEHPEWETGKETEEMKEYKEKVSKDLYLL